MGVCCLFPLCIAKVFFKKMFLLFQYFSKKFATDRVQQGRNWFRAFTVYFFTKFISHIFCENVAYMDISPNFVSTRVIGQSHPEFYSGYQRKFDLFSLRGLIKWKESSGVGVILFFSKVAEEITNVAKMINIDYHLLSRHGEFYCILWFSKLI